MKSFFELIGFAATALVTGFLVFSYVGQKKNADKTDVGEKLVTAFNKEEDDAASLPDLEPVSGSRMIKEKKASKGAAAAEMPASRKPVLAVESASATEKLKKLYGDEAFVRETASKWKKQVAEAGETHSVKSHLLLGNVIVKSYLGNYTARDFNRDVSEHAGDIAVPNSVALKSYDYSWSVGKVAQQYNLTRYFPASVPVAAAKIPVMKSVGTPKKSAAPQKPKAAASVTPLEAGFREMVAKEEGFSSWQGLLRLGDPDTKKNAERRVKTLMGAAKVR